MPNCIIYNIDNVIINYFAINNGKINIFSCYFIKYIAMFQDCQNTVYTLFVGLLIIITFWLAFKPRYIMVKNGSK